MNWQAIGDWFYNQFVNLPGLTCLGAGIVWTYKKLFRERVTVNMYIAYKIPEDKDILPLEKQIYLVVSNRTAHTVTWTMMVWEDTLWRRFFGRYRPIVHSERKIMEIPPGKAGMVEVSYLENNFISPTAKFFGIRTQNRKTYWLSRKKWKRVQKEYIRDFPNARPIAERKIQLRDYSAKPKALDDKANGGQ